MLTLNSTALAVPAPRIPSSVQSINFGYPQWAQKAPRHEVCIGLRSRSHVCPAKLTRMFGTHCWRVEPGSSRVLIRKGDKWQLVSAPMLVPFNTEGEAYLLIEGVPFTLHRSA